jgi:hypothetical protein
MTPVTRARGMVEARLSRHAQDELEAAVVLEAWCGFKATTALALGHKVVRRERQSAPPRSLDVMKRARRAGAAAEGIALVLAVVAVATWASPITRELGAGAWESAIRLALPLTLALQWLLWSRYLGHDGGLGRLRHEAPGVLAVGAGIAGALASLGIGGIVAAMLVATWTGGTILVRRGWVLWYALVLALSAIALHDGAPALPLLAAAALTVLLATTAALLTQPLAAGSPSPWRQAILAALVGGGLGTLLIADHTIGWGVRGYLPALALIPSAVGGFWAGHSLSRVYSELPRGLRGIAVTHADQIALRGTALKILAGSVLRLIFATVGLSAICVLASPWTSGTLAISLMVAFGCLALATLLVSLLLSLGHAGRTVFAVAAAVATEAILQLSHSMTRPGDPLIAGACVSVLLVLPAILRLFMRPGRVLATAFWIP